MILADQVVEIAAFLKIFITVIGMITAVLNAENVTIIDINRFHTAQHNDKVLIITLAFFYTYVVFNIYGSCSAGIAVGSRYYAKLYTGRS